MAHYWGDNFSNASRNFLNFYKRTQITEYKACGNISTYITKTTLINGNTHVVHDMPSWYIHGILGLGTNQEK